MANRQLAREFTILQNTLEVPRGAARTPSHTAVRDRMTLHPSTAPAPYGIKVVEQCSRTGHFLYRLLLRIYAVSHGISEGGGLKTSFMNAFGAPARIIPYKRASGEPCADWTSYLTQVSIGDHRPLYQALRSRHQEGGVDRTSLDSYLIL